jgi:hypothetical protein
MSSVSSKCGPVGGIHEEYSIFFIWFCSGSVAAIFSSPTPTVDECRDTRYRHTSRTQKRGRRSCFTSVSHRKHCQHRSHLVQEGVHASWPVLRWYPLYGNNSSFSDSPRTRSHNKCHSIRVKRLPASLASLPAPACGTDLTKVTTPSQRMVKFVSSFKQKQFSLVWHTPQHSWHGNETDLLIDELRVPTGHPFYRYCSERSNKHVLRNDNAMSDM